MNIADDISGIVRRFRSVSLEGVQEISLMKRRDRKYLFDLQKVPALLESIKDTYKVLEIEGTRVHPYRTVYFDTRDLEMYHKHHRGKANRHKVRIRNYGTSDGFFLEVKLKDAKGVTIKKRTDAGGAETSELLKREKFLTTASPYSVKDLIPSLENRFKRITLAGRDRKERITIDFEIGFASPSGNEWTDLPAVAVAEIKYQKILSDSHFGHVLRGASIQPGRFSKYAIGMALLHPALKQNLFKNKVRKVHQINNQYIKTA